MEKVLSLYHVAYRNYAQKTKSPRKSLTKLRIENNNGGGGEIRTHGTLRHDSFQNYWNKPLSDSSNVLIIPYILAFFN